MDILKGWRTIIITFLSAGVGNVGIINDLVIAIADIVGAQLSEGGAIAALAIAATTIKQLVTDAIPKMKGETVTK